MRVSPKRKSRVSIANDERAKGRTRRPKEVVPNRGIMSESIVCDNVGEREKKREGLLMYKKTKEKGIKR